jgi:organic radical activating enzyme
MKYPLAKQGVFRTIQGEGVMLGLPMVFVRFAGCSVGCPGCDTDYKLASKASREEIVKACLALASPACNWVWLTGGEPTDHDIGQLIDDLRGHRLKVALATAGHKRQPDRWANGGVDFLSVSPHDPSAWVQDWGQELKLVPGLNGFALKDFEPKLPGLFGECFVSPCDGKPETVQECVDWVLARPRWRMNCQAHKQWGIA